MHAHPRPLPSYALRRLSLGRRLLFSALLVLAIATAVGTLLATGILVAWNTEGSFAAFDLGSALCQLFARDPRLYWTLAGLHSAALLGLVPTATALFAKTSIRRQARGALIGVVRLLTALDVLAWVLGPYVDAARNVAGLLGLGALVAVALISLYPLVQMWAFTAWKSPPKKPVRVVVVGGGFAGLYALLGLDKRLGHADALEVTLVDQNNYFLFPPLLPSVASGAIETRQVTYPFRRILEGTSVTFRKAQVLAIDPAARTIAALVDTDACHDAQTDPAGAGPQSRISLGYDYLVLAPGAVTQTFGTKGAHEHAFFMRSLEDAVSVRNHVIDCFERAAVPGASPALLRFVVVGAGPTGIEIATEIKDLVDQVLLKRYPEIRPETVDVTIVQAGAQILPGWDDGIVTRAAAQLARLGVKVRLDAGVAEVHPAHVVLRGGERLATRTCIWCAGVKSSPLLAASGLPLDKSGRVPVGPDLRTAAFPEVFVLGDSAHFVPAGAERPLPPLGQVAFQQGAATAANLARLLRGAPTRAFRYFDFGALVSVGEHYAVVKLLGVRLTGFIGWVVWRSLYLTKLVGASNRLRVLLDWTLDLLIERSISQIRGGAEEGDVAVAVAAPVAAPGASASTPPDDVRAPPVRTERSA